MKKIDLQKHNKLFFNYVEISLNMQQEIMKRVNLSHLSLKYHVKNNLFTT